METWATFSIIDYLKPIGDQTQEELDQLEAVDYLREAQAGELSFFCREFTLSDAPETHMNRRGDFSTIYKRDHFVESVGGRGGVCLEVDIKKGVQRIVAALEKTDSDRLLTFVNALTALAAKMEPPTAAEMAKVGAQRLVAALENPKETACDRLFSLGSALATLAAKVQPQAAAEGTCRKLCRTLRTFVGI
jgi:hypothetical protein